MSADTRYNESSLIDNGLTTQALFGGGLGIPPVWTTLGANVKAWLVTPTSANLLSAVATTSTGTGSLVFGTSPTFTTSIIAGSSTMALLNTTATTVNAFGAATSIVIGGANVSGTTIQSQLYLPLNSLTTGTGLYLASTSLTSGKLLDISTTSLNVSGSIVGLNIGLSGSNFTSIVTTTGATISNTRTGTSSTNIALTLTASGGTTNTALNVTAGGVVIGSSGTAITSSKVTTIALSTSSIAAQAVREDTLTVTDATTTTPFAYTLSASQSNDLIVMSTRSDSGHCYIKWYNKNAVSSASPAGNITIRTFVP